MTTAPDCPAPDHPLVEEFPLSFYLFLLVVVSLSCGSSPAWQEPTWRSVVASAGVVAGWSLLCHLAARMLSVHVRQGRLSLWQANRFLQTQLDILRWLGLPITVLCLVGFSLAAWARQQPILEHSLLLQSFVLLSPGLAVLMSTWSAEHYFGVGSGLTRPGFGHWMASLWSGLRAGPAWLIGPTCLFMGLGDLADWLSTSGPAPSGAAPSGPASGGAASSVAAQSGPGWNWLDAVQIGLHPSLALMVVGGVILVALLPRLVVAIVKTEPVDTPQAKEIEGWLRGCGLSTHAIWGTRVVRWNTRRRMMNGLIAGLFPWGRALLLSDRLLDELPRRELLMVVMHEVAHAKRWHVVLRMAAIVPAWGVASWVGQSLATEAWEQVVGGIAGLLTTVVALAVVSYATELDADAQACRLAVRVIGREAPDTALDEDSVQPERWLAEALFRVTSDHPESRRASWLHPSLAMRSRYLKRRAERRIESECSSRAGSRFGQADADVPDQGRRVEGPHEPKAVPPHAWPSSPTTTSTPTPLHQTGDDAHTCFVP